MNIMPLDEHTSFHLANLFSALSDPARVRIIELLLDCEQSVGSIAAQLGMANRLSPTNCADCAYSVLSALANRRSNLPKTVLFSLNQRLLRQKTHPKDKIFGSPSSSPSPLLHLPSPPSPLSPLFLLFPSSPPPPLPSLPPPPPRPYPLPITTIHPPPPPPPPRPPRSLTH